LSIALKHSVSWGPSAGVISPAMGIPRPHRAPSVEFTTETRRKLVQLVGDQ
jgi:hypothetical protein